MKAKAKSLTKPASLRVKFDKIKPFSVKDRLKTEGNACYSLLLKWLKSLDCRMITLIW